MRTTLFIFVITITPTFAGGQLREPGDWGPNGVTALLDKAGDCYWHDSLYCAEPDPRGFVRHWGREYEYKTKYPRPPVGSLIPGYARIYEVDSLPEGALRSERSALLLRFIPESSFPPAMRRKQFSFATSVGAVTTVGRDREPNPPRPLLVYDTHLRVVRVDRPAGDETPATAAIEVWKEGGEAQRRTETLKTGDTLRAGRWTFRVSNVVPPDETTKVVGWVEFFLVGVDEKPAAEEKPVAKP